MPSVNTRKVLLDETKTHASSFSSTSKPKIASVKSFAECWRTIFDVLWFKSDRNFNKSDCKDANQEYLVRWSILSCHELGLFCLIIFTFLRWLSSSTWSTSRPTPHFTIGMRAVLSAAFWLWRLVILIHFLSGDRQCLRKQLKIFVWDTILIQLTRKTKKIKANVVGFIVYLLLMIAFDVSNLYTKLKSDKSLMSFCLTRTNCNFQRSSKKCN